MRKLVGMLFAVLAFTFKIITLFTAVIIGIDLVNRYIEDHTPKNAAETE